MITLQAKLMHALLGAGFGFRTRCGLLASTTPVFQPAAVPLTTVAPAVAGNRMTAMGVMPRPACRPAMPTRDVFLATKLVVRDSCSASKVQAPTAEEPMADPLAI